MNWFRLHVDARNDAKLRTLSDAEHRVWFNLLCYSAEQEPRGSVTGVTSVTDVTDDLLLAIEVASGDTALLSSTVEKLVTLRILTIDDDGLTFVNFRKRQYDKPSDMPEETRRRKAAQRERDRAESGVTDPDERVTGVTPRDVTPRTEQSRADTEQSEEPAQAPETPPDPIKGDEADDADNNGPGKSKASRKPAESFCPDTFPLEEKHYQYGGSKGLTKSEIEAETEKFLLWHGAKGTRYTNWYKAWQTWIIRAGQDKAKLTPFQQPSPDDEVPGFESWRQRKAVLPA